ncbi:hypothetical protein Tco_0288755, partial [Tanacetum coccineum]
QFEVSSVESTANKFLQTPHHEMSSFLFQCAPSSLRQVLHVDILGNVFERRKKPG